MAPRLGRCLTAVAAAPFRGPTWPNHYIPAASSRPALLDDQVRFLKGWFKDTLPTAPIAQLAVLRLDGDLYESTWDALTHLYPKLSQGGFVIIDDYNHESCQQAVHDYRTQHGVDAPILDIDRIGVYWRNL